MVLGTEKRLQRKAEVLQVVRELVREHGYASLTVGDIARESGVAVATLYNRFGSKSGLVLAASHEFYEQVIDDADEAGTEPGIERLFVLLDHIVAALTGDERYAREIVAASNDIPRDATIRGETPSLRRQLIEAYAARLSDMADRGELVSWAAPWSVADTIIMGMTGVMRVWGATTREPAWMERHLRRSLYVTLLGVTQGAARDEVERRARPLMGPAE